MYKTTPHISPWRFWSFYAVLLVCIVGFAVQLVRLQVLDYDVYAAQALDNRQDIVNIPAQRGVIFDRNRVVLARNIPSFNVAITPADLPEDDVRLQAIYHRISFLTGVPITTPPLDAGNASSNRPGEDDPPPVMGVDGVAWRCHCSRIAEELLPPGSHQHWCPVAIDDLDLSVLTLDLPDRFHLLVITY